MSRNLVVFGLSLSSSWGNGHAPTFRGLFRALAQRGWSVTFFERDVEWYRSNRDLPDPDFCDLRFYDDLPDLRDQALLSLKSADAVLVGSLVADGPALVDWLAELNRPLFYYDIDTPITLDSFADRGSTDYIRSDQIALFETCFSFTGGPALVELERMWGAQHAEALYCGVDPTIYRPVPPDSRFHCLLSYAGTYAVDRQPSVEEMLFAPAVALPGEQFFLAGAQYPPMQLPPNVRHVIHVYQRDHAALYCSSWAILNLTRTSMRKYGWSPSTRMFEAAASGACIISDTWPGLDQLFCPGVEVLLAKTRQDVLRHLSELSPARRGAIGEAARIRVLRDHSYDQRAVQFERAVDHVLAQGEGRRQWASAS